jgi:hypothetical protein
MIGEQGDAVRRTALPNGGQKLARELRRRSAAGMATCGRPEPEILALSRRSGYARKAVETEFSPSNLISKCRISNSPMSKSVMAKA